MEEAKVDPTGLQCDKLHKEGRYGSLQATLHREGRYGSLQATLYREGRYGSLQATLVRKTSNRGHDTNSNVPSTNQSKEEMTQNN